MALKFCFVKIIGLANFIEIRDGEALVSNYIEWVNGHLHWKPLFLREAQDVEMELLEHISDELYAMKVGCLGRN